MRWYIYRFKRLVARGKQNCFQRLHQKGIPVVLVTGRNDFLTKDYVDELGFQCPVIGGNGATLGNIYTGERKYVNAMTRKK